MKYVDVRVWFIVVLLTAVTNVIQDFSIRELRSRIVRCEARP